jgi:uncharacterized membrane protein YgcG
MTPEEKENMQLTIKNAMLEGFQEFAKTMNENIEKSIETHRLNCPSKNSTSFVATLKDWKTIAAAIFAIAWILSSVMSAATGKNAVLTPEQAKQIAKQIMQFDPNLILK